MSNYRRIRVTGGGNLRKWTEMGQTIEGHWRGTRPGKFGDLGMIDTDHEGRVTFPIHTALVNKLARIREGASIAIVYKGKVKAGKSGNEYKDFDVMVEREEDLLDAEEEHRDGESDVPF